jgi:hypothetical protein
VAVTSGATVRASVALMAISYVDIPTISGMAAGGTMASAHAGLV